MNMDEAFTTTPRRAGKSASAFRTISEVSAELGVPQHVLRFWESKFGQVRPLKRGGGRRYYRPEDIELLRTIRGLLYDEGYTIRGVQKLLREGAVKPGSEPDPESKSVASIEQAAGELARDGLSGRQRAALRALLDELESLKRMLDAQHRRS